MYKRVSTFDGNQRTILTTSYSFSSAVYEY